MSKTWRLRPVEPKQNFMSQINIACVLSHFSRVWLCVAPWTAAHQAPLSMDFPGKSTGLGCHSFSNAWKWKWKGSRSVMFNSLWPHGLQPTRLLRPWDFPGKNTGVGCHSLLQWMSLPICKNITDENSAITRLSHCESSLVKREQLKGHHTIYKPARRGHPDFSLLNSF